MVASVWAILLAILIKQPGYTDAYYYFNAGQRLAQHEGLTDPYLWEYFNAPDKLPAPSHTYWMPLESLVAAASMVVLGASFGAAQVPSVMCFVGLAVFAFWLGGRWGNSRRHAWITGLLVVFSGFYTAFWTTTDTFALFGLVSALALVCVGLERECHQWRWTAAAGFLSALAHLTRADGVLVLGAVVLAVLWPTPGRSARKRIMSAVVAIGVYLVVMLPWFIRNIDAVGTPLPTAGTATIWFRNYDELVNYPAGASMASFWNWGVSNIVRSRLEALANNLGTFVAVETWVVLAPFVFLGMRRYRHKPLFLGIAVYALLLHVVMTFVFAFPGYRGGLFHSSAALLPFWAAFGLAGLDDAVVWMSRRRRWNRVQAQTVFSGALVVLAVALSVGIVKARVPSLNSNAERYKALAAQLPPDAVVMINDPPALYYHTGLWGVVVPNQDPDVVPAIAERFGVTYLLLDANRTQPFTGLWRGTDYRPFLRLIAVDDGGTQGQSGRPPPVPDSQRGDSLTCAGFGGGAIESIW